MLRAEVNVSAVSHDWSRDRGQPCMHSTQNHELLRSLFSRIFRAMSAKSDALSASAAGGVKPRSARRGAGCLTCHLLCLFRQLFRPLDIGAKLIPCLASRRRSGRRAAAIRPLRPAAQARIAEELLPIAACLDNRRQRSATSRTAPSASAAVATCRERPREPTRRRRRRLLVLEEAPVVEAAVAQPLVCAPFHIHELRPVGSRHDIQRPACRPAPRQREQDQHTHATLVGWGSLCVEQ